MSSIKQDTFFGVSLFFSKWDLLLPFFCGGGVRWGWVGNYISNGSFFESIMTLNFDNSQVSSIFDGFCSFYCRLYMFDVVSE